MENLIAFLADNHREVIIAILIGIIFFLLVPWHPRLNPPPQSSQPIPIDIPSIINAIRIKTEANFLSDSEITSLGQSILKIDFQNDDKSWSSGQCFVYAHKDSTTYIGLPKHCYNKNNSLVTLKDHTGTSYEYSWHTTRYFVKFDAAMIPVLNSPLLHLPSLCGQGLIKDSEQFVNNSVFCVTPFNVRGMKVKSGKILAKERVLCDFFCGEGGDSGSLIVGKHGVIGMQVARSKEDAKKISFIDIQKMEDLYMALTS